MITIIGAPQVVFPSSAVVYGLQEAWDQTNSTTYVPMWGGSESLSFRKLSSSTAIRIDMNGTVELSGSGYTEATFGVRINGRDIDVCTRFVDLVADRQSWGGTIHVHDIPAGTWTIDGIWRVSGGPGALNRYAGDDWTSIAAMEVISQ